MLAVQREDTDHLSDGSVGTISPANSVYVNGERLMALGGQTSMGGRMITGSTTVFAEGIPVCRLYDLATSPLFGKAFVIEGSPNTFSA